MVHFKSASVPASRLLPPKKDGVEDGDLVRADGLSKGHHCRRRLRPAALRRPRHRLALSPSVTFLPKVQADPQVVNWGNVLGDWVGLMPGSGGPSCFLSPHPPDTPSPSRRRTSLPTSGAGPNSPPATEVLPSKPTTKVRFLRFFRILPALSYVMTVLVILNFEGLAGLILLSNKTVAADGLSIRHAIFNHPLATDGGSPHSSM